MVGGNSNEPAVMVHRKPGRLVTYRKRSGRNKIFSYRAQHDNRSVVIIAVENRD